MRDVTAKNIDGITDLVVIAPIKPGMIDAFENITYETRLKVVAEALHKIRVNAREHELVAPFADTAERILTLFNFRIGVLDLDVHRLVQTAVADQNSIEPVRYMFLVATFDGPFEPYMRLIWNPLGPFLDLLLCNCEGYKLATKTGFPEYLDWVRRHQVEPSIFYSTSGLTLRDQIYLGQLEKLTRTVDPATADPQVDRLMAAMTVLDPEKKAAQVWAEPSNWADAIRLSFEAVSVLYRLADYFPVDTIDNGGEGAILLNAAQDLLLGLKDRIAALYALQIPVVKARLDVLLVSPGPFREQWGWFTKAIPSTQLPAPTEPPRSEVQRGLLSGFDTDGFETHYGMVLLLAVADAERASNTIKLLLEPNWEGDGEQFSTTNGLGRLIKNLAFTPAGLKAMGLRSAQMNSFPKEFREGLFKRAPLLGDVRESHPRRWKMPPRFDVRTGQGDRERPAIHSEEIDLIVQWRLALPTGPERANPTFRDFESEAFGIEAQLKTEHLFDRFQQRKQAIFASQLNGLGLISNTGLMAFVEGASSHLDSRIEEILSAADDLPRWAFLLDQFIDLTGLRLMAVESSFRPLQDAAVPAGSRNLDHFGFVDGISQPEAALVGPDTPAPADTVYDNRIPYGDIVNGHLNGRRDGPAEQNWDGKQALLENGSFMVLRKIAQYPERLAELEGANSLPIGAVAEAMVGRKHEGTPLAFGHGPGLNDFTYELDREQLGCPFSAHIRLANPREPFQKRKEPRILRRGMAYGRKYDPAVVGSEKEPRGVLFMAYNASLAEQYEVIQRWLNGANPTNVASAANDPLTGAVQEAGIRTFRWRTADGQVHRIAMPKPVTQVQWGVYGFVPSKTALATICNLTNATIQVSDDSKGKQRIEQLQQLPFAQQRREWKRLLEDFSVKDTADQDATPEVWRAIRTSHEGVLRLPCGIEFGGNTGVAEGVATDATPVVLVASKSLIMEVLSDPQTFSSSEQLARTKASFGAIFVSMDPDPADRSGNLVSDYAKESFATNAEVYRFSEENQEDVFNEAYARTKARLELAKTVNASIDIADSFKVELRRDLLTPVLGELCTWLFDIPDTDVTNPTEGFIDKGPWGWKPIDTHGGTTVAEGKRKPRCPADFMSPSRFSFYPRPSAAIQGYGRHHGAGLRNASVKLIEAKRTGGFDGKISKALAEQIADNDLLARNIVGNMEGMLPPIDGILRGIAYEWVDRDELWRNQSRFLELRPRAGNPTLGRTRLALEDSIKTAMCKRPAPDLLYRRATRDTVIAGKEVKAGDTVILALVSPMLESLDQSDPDIELVFGGKRKAAWQEPGEPPHACPAYGMVMAMIYGIVAAMFDAGRITVQPASLILKFSDWPMKGASDDEVTVAETSIDISNFSPFT